jgi:hypothetical protein
MCGLEIGCRKRATQAMVGDHLIHPIEAPKMVLVELAGLRRAQRAEDPYFCRGWDRPARLQGTRPPTILPACRLRERHWAALET